MCLIKKKSLLLSEYISDYPGQLTLGIHIQVVYTYQFTGKYSSTMNNYPSFHFTYYLRISDKIKPFFPPKRIPTARVLD